MSSFLKNLYAGAGWAVRISCAFYAAEIVAIVSDGINAEAMLKDVFMACLIAGCLYGILGVALAVLLAAVFAYVGGSSSTAALTDAFVERMLAAMTTSDPDLRREFVAKSLGLLFFLAAVILGGTVLIREIIVTIEQPLYGALVSMCAVVGCVAASLALWPVWLRTGRLLSFLPRTTVAPWMTCAIIFGIGLLAVGLAIPLTWSTLAKYVRWRAPLVIAGGAIIVAVWFIVERLRSPSRKIARPGLLICAIVFTSGAITCFAIPDSYEDVIALVRQSEGPTTPVLRIVSAALDFDGDDYSAWLGGGDCDGFDPSINPGALDLDGDGIDQNCDGFDNTSGIIVNPGRHDYPGLEPTKPMPVILVTIDAVSALRMDLYGAKRTTMPKLTKRAQQGVVFNWAFSEGPATRLSFPSIMSGRHNGQIRRKLTRRTMAPWENVDHTIASVFADSGYLTEAVLPDRYFSKKMKWLNKGFKRVDKSAIVGKSGELKNGPQVTKAALARLDAMKEKDKFFLWVHYIDAHARHVLPPGCKATFGKEEADIYDRELLYLDVHLENLLAGIEHRLKGRDYLLALTADHGQAFDERHKTHHQDHDLSTAVTWVPLIFWSSRLEPGRVDRVATSIDLMPTLLNAVGLKAPGLAGDSLIPDILGKQQSDRPVLQQFYLPELRAKKKHPLKRWAVRQGPYVLYKTRFGGERLYNYQKDPLETENLIGEQPQVAIRLRHSYSSFLSWAYQSWNLPHKN